MVVYKKTHKKALPLLPLNILDTESKILKYKAYEQYITELSTDCWTVCTLYTVRKFNR